MNNAEYRQALEKLGLKPASRITAAALCCSVRQSQRYAAGASPIPLWLERLLYLLLVRGSIPRAWRRVGQPRFEPSGKSKRCVADKVVEPETLPR